MKYFLACPYCGQDLLKAENGSQIKITCPKCNEHLTIEVKDDHIIIGKDPKGQHDQ
jgi:phage FluMu protein Com